MISPRTFLATGRIVLQAATAVIGILLLNFLLLKLLPGDAVDVIAAESGITTLEGLAELRDRLGLNAPVLTQMLNYLYNVLHFDLGFSARYNAPVLDLILSRLGPTLLLMMTALAFALVVGIAAGAVMAAFPNSWVDRTLSVVALIFYSTPAFWLALMLVVVFSVNLGWLPGNGSHTIGANLHGLDFIRDRASYLVLPAFALGSFYVAIYARLTRATMLEVQQQDYVRTARAKGVPPFVVQTRHVLRNALIPVTTMAGVHVGNLLGGAVVVETIFGWPGMGRLALEAVLARDFAVLMGILLMSSILVIVLNALVDLLHTVLDPRMEGH